MVALALGSLDRLVELAEERGGRVRASEAASFLFAVRRAPEGLARSLLVPLVEADARLAWRGQFVALAGAPNPALADTTFVVVDLETTGLRRTDRICEIGAVRIRRLELADSFETLVSPARAVPAAVARLTGLTDAALAGAPDAGAAVAAFAAFAGDAVLVAHNARFDLGFLDRELERATGRRLARPAVDTVALARNLLRGRVARTSLASLAFFFGTSVEPCHRALPDALATAEVFMALVELASERGACTLAELEELAAPRARRIHAKRRLIDGAPASPGVYLFCGADGEVLYVGKARELRTRLRSYFHTPRQRPPVEAALDRADAVRWRVSGSELAAAIDEVGLIRALRPTANARTPRPERYVYLHRRGEAVVLSRAPSRYGPLRAPLEARRAARALRGCSGAEFEGLLDGDPLDRLRARMSALSLEGRDLDLRRIRREVAALERVIAALRQVEELRALRAGILAPALEPATIEAFVVAGGRLERHALPARGARSALRALLAPPQRPGPPRAPIAADDLDALLVFRSFLSSPTAELAVVTPDPAVG